MIKQTIIFNGELLIDTATAALAEQRMKKLVEIQNKKAIKKEAENILVEDAIIDTDEGV